MIKNRDSKSKILISFVVAIVLHAAILAFVKYDVNDFAFLNQLSEATKNLNRPIKIDRIDLIKPEDVQRIKRVGIKGGNKNAQAPDLAFNPPITRPDSRPTELPQKGNSSKGNPKLSLDKLAPTLPTPNKKPLDSNPNTIAKNFLKSASATNDSGGHFYFNYKEQKVIPRSQDQEILKK